MSPVYLAGLAGIILSALFRYVPKLNTWFVEQADETKQLIMLGLIALAAVVTYGVSCSALNLPFITSVECSVKGINVLVENIILALVTNQAAHNILPKPKAVKVAEKLGDLKREPAEKKLVADAVEEKRVEDDKK